MSEKKLDAIGKFFRAMFDKPAWWYGVSIPDADRNSLSRLLQVSYHEFVDLMIDIGWMKRHYGGRGEKKEFIAVKTDTIIRFIEQSGLSAIAEIARISYKNQRNCCFIRLGTFSDGPPFAALSVVHDPGKAPPPITNTKSDQNLRDALQQLQSFFVGNNNLPPQPEGTLQSTVTKISRVPIHEDTNPSFGILQNKNEDNIGYHTAQPRDIGSTPSTPTEMQLSDDEIEDNIVLQTMIQQILLPTIFKEDFVANSYWRDPSMFGNVASAIGKLSSYIVSRNEQRMMDAMGCNPAMMTPQETSAQLPALKKYGVQVSNKTSVQKLLRDCVTLSHKHPKHNLLTTVMSNGRAVTLVEIPRSESLSLLKKRDVSHKWVTRMLDALGTPVRKKKKVQKHLLPSCLKHFDANNSMGNNAVEDASENTQEQPNQTDLLGESNNEQQDNDDSSIDSDDDPNDNDLCSDHEINARNLLHHFCNKFPNAFRKVALQRSVDVLKKPLDAVATFAMWSEANINIKQARIIARHLRVWYNHPVVTGDDKWKRTLLNSSSRKVVIPHCGTYNNKNEKVDWSVRDPVKVVLYFLDGIYNHRKTRKKWHSIDLVLSCDHGKGFSRAHLVIICRIFDEKTMGWSEFTESFALGDAKCRKDTYEILKNTFMPTLNGGFGKLVGAGGFEVWERRRSNPPINVDNVSDDRNRSGETENGEDENNDDEEINEMERFYTVLTGSAQENESNTCLYKNIPINVIAAGDIAQLMTNYGRDGYAGSWCIFCTCSKKNWQDFGHEKGTEWSVSSLKTHLKSLSKDETDPQKRMGVRCEPLLPSIDLRNNSFPSLHVKIGVVNYAWDACVDAIQDIYEVYTTRYLFLENNFNRRVEEERTTRIQVQETKARVAMLKRTLKARIQQTNILEVQTDLDESTLLLLQVEADKRQRTTELKKARTAFEEEAKVAFNTRAEGQQVRAAVEEIAKKYGVNKGIYFGGDLQGPGCTALLKNRKEIFNEVSKYLCSLPQGQKLAPDGTIKEILGGYEDLAGHLDGLFSICCKKRYHIVQEDITILEQHVEHTCALWRALGHSFTTKMHLIEDHLLEMLQRFGGLGDIGEDEGERGHQTGHQNELRCRSLHHQQKMKSITEHESMKQNEKVRSRQDAVRNATTRRKKGETMAVVKKRKREEERKLLLASKDKAIYNKFANMREMRKDALAKMTFVLER